MTMLVFLVAILCSSDHAVIVFLVAILYLGDHAMVVFLVSSCVQVTMQW